MEAVSVVIPTYNRAPLISRALSSVLADLSDGDEIIVVDDGSIDDTEEAVRRLADGSPVPIVYHRTRNGGVGKARNVGIALARNPLVAFLDSDDEWLPGWLRMKRGLMTARPDLVFCFSDFQNRWVDGRVRHGASRVWHCDDRDWDDILSPRTPYSSLATIPQGCTDAPVHIGDMYPVLVRACYVATQTSIVRRSLAGDDFRFAEDVPLFEEWDCFARLARRGLVAFLNSETVIQWSHDGPRNTHISEFDRATSALAVLQRVWGTDAEFLAKHADAYREHSQGLHRTIAGELAHRGDGRAARAELRFGGRIPLRLWVLTRLPHSVTRMFVQCATRRRNGPVGASSTRGGAVHLGSDTGVGKGD